MATIYLAWTLADPVGWEAHEVVNSQDVRSLPNGGVPTRAFDPVLDGNEKKWLSGINIQGVSIVGFDHFGPAIDGTTGRILVHAWNDDPVDWPSPWGITWSFGNPRIDPNVGNRMNTDQLLTVWGNDAYLAGATTTGGPVVHSPWADFTEPGPANLVRHGVWVDSDCEVCAHTIDDHAGGTGSACSYEDCIGYDSLWQRQMNAMNANTPGWREYIGA